MVVATVTLVAVVVLVETEVTDVDVLGQVSQRTGQNTRTSKSSKIASGSHKSDGTPLQNNGSTLPLQVGVVVVELVELVAVEVSVLVLGTIISFNRFPGTVTTGNIWGLQRTELLCLSIYQRHFFGIWYLSMFPNFLKKFEGVLPILVNNILNLKSLKIPHFVLLRQEERN